jgi:rare lipoprotein A
MVSASPISISQTLPPIQPILGIASWYSETDPYINIHTANGEVFDDSQMTCASWDYRFGTRLQVTNLANGRSVICRVNDRGPARRLGRLVDLTKAAFREVASLTLGLIDVSVTRLEPSR